MEKKKLDKIISIVREEMMTANAPGTSGGFGGDAPAKGPRAGFSPVIVWKQAQKDKEKEVKKDKKYIKLPPGSRKRWK